MYLLLNQGLLDSLSKYAPQIGAGSVATTNYQYIYSSIQQSKLQLGA
jgi:hypothetical protein